MTKRILSITAAFLATGSLSGYALAAHAANHASHAAPTLQSLASRVGVLENEVKDLRRQQFADQLVAIHKQIYTLEKQMLYLCSQPNMACPSG